MGKGTIQSHLGEGKYSIKLLLHRERVNQRIQKLTDQIAAIDTTELAAAEDKLTQAQAELNQAIDDQDAAIATQDRDTMSAAAKAVAEQAAERDKARVERDRIKLRLASLKKEKTYLESNMPDDPVVEAWCTDYSEELTGDVGTIEINAEHQAPVVVRPGFPGDSAHDPVRDGEIQPAIASSIPGVFYNWALLPGVQIARPQYRLGAITALSEDTCTVDLDAATSSAQDLPINETDTLTEVPIVYMDCHGAAFEVGDRVVVEFENRDWSKPRVIGFESQPRECKPAVFLESGCVDVRGLFGDTPDPAGKLYYSPRQTAQLPLEFPWLDKIVEMPPEPEIQVRAYTEGMDSVGINADTGDKQLYAAKGFGAATGKVQLLAQGALGSDKANSLWSLGVDGKLSQTYALYTTADYRYYLLTVNASSITGQEVTLKKGGDRLREWLRVPDNAATLDPEDLKRLEAYMLSSAQLDPATFPLLDDFTVEGTPFWYGWHFNWKGTEACLVTNEPILAGDPPVIVYHTARRYRLSVSETGNPDQPLDATVTEAETGDWTPRVNEDLIWYPDPHQTGGMATFIPITGPSYPYPAMIDGDVPVYGFYDAGDALKMVRYKRTTSSQAIDQAAFDAVKKTRACGGQTASDANEQFETTVTAGFYLADFTVEASRIGVYNQANMSLTLTGKTRLACGSTSSTPPNCADEKLVRPDGDSCVPPYLAINYEEGGANMYYKESLDLQVSVESYLLIPWGSAETVYLGKLKHRREVGTLYDVTKSILGKVTATKSGQEISSAVSLDENYRVGAGVSDGSETVRHDGPYEYDRFDLTVRAYTKNTTLAIEDLTLEGDSDQIYFDLGRWTALFDPVLFGNAAYPYFDHAVRIRESAFGDAYYVADVNKASYAEMVEVNTDLPQELLFNGLFTGWA